MRENRIYDCEEESNKIVNYQKEACDVETKEISIGPLFVEDGFLRNFTSVTLHGRFY